MPGQAPLVNFILFKWREIVLEPVVSCWLKGGVAANETTPSGSLLLKSPNMRQQWGGFREIMHQRGREFLKWINQTLICQTSLVIRVR